MIRAVPRVLSFPLRVGIDGSLATVDQGSDAYVDECIGVAMLTRPGEIILAPTFGVDDPAFAGFDAAALQRHLLDFGPDVTITNVATVVTGPDTEQVRVSWERNGALL